MRSFAGIPSTFAALFLCLALIACSGPESSREVDRFRVAVLPDQTEAQLRLIYQPLLDYLQTQTDFQFQLEIPESYAELLQWFEEGKVDLAFFGGVTFVKAHASSEAVPLVMRDVDAIFNSLALGNADNPATSLQEFKASRLAFGSSLSTSGHYMPRYFLSQQGIYPEVFFSKVMYSGAHDTTAYWVRDKKVELGIANSKIINAMFADGRLNADELKIVWRSPPYADYVWALQAGIDSLQKNALRDAFLGMHNSEQGRIILKALQANYFIPAGMDDFERLENVVIQVEHAGINQ